MTPLVILLLYPVVAYFGITRKGRKAMVDVFGFFDSFRSTRGKINQQKALNSQLQKELDELQELRQEQGKTILLRSSITKMHISDPPEEREASAQVREEDRDEARPSGKGKPKAVPKERQKVRPHR